MVGTRTSVNLLFVVRLKQMIFYFVPWGKGVNHHLSTVWGNFFGTFSKHRTCKSKLFRGNPSTLMFDFPTFCSSRLFLLDEKKHTHTHTKKKIHAKGRKIEVFIHSNVLFFLRGPLEVPQPVDNALKKV